MSATYFSNCSATLFQLLRHLQKGMLNPTKNVPRKPPKVLAVHRTIDTPLIDVSIHRLSMFRHTVFLYRPLSLLFIRKYSELNFI